MVVVEVGAQWVEEGEEPENERKKKQNNSNINTMECRTLATY